MKNELNMNELGNVAGGTVYDDLSAEEILEEARKLAIWWKEQGRPLEAALDTLSRYMFIPGKVTRAEVDQIIKEVYGVA